MPAFKTRKRIELQPYDQSVPYSFGFSVCSSATANDGDLPYGHNIQTCLVKCFDKAGADKTTDVVGVTSVNANIVTVPLTYYATHGRYSLEFQVETDLAVRIEFPYTRVYMIDRS